LDELHNKLRRTCYVRRDKEDVMPELPDKQRQRLDLDISNRREYDAAESDIVAYMKKEAETGSDLLGDIDNPDEAAEQVERNMGQGPNNNMAEKLVKVMKLKQLAAKGKFKPAKSWIKDFLENESPLVVFGWHTDIVKGMADAFDAPHITGDTPSKDRHRIVQEFQNGQHDLLSLNMHAAGEGITLTEASNVAFLELPWTWGTVSQCEARVHRIGTESAVNIYFLLGNDTIDSDVFELLREKRIVSEKVNRGKDPTDGKGNIVRGVIEKLQQK
jgi:SNF2 family DNA or RNA helicase